MDVLPGGGLRVHSAIGPGTPAGRRLMAIHTSQSRDSALMKAERGFTLLELLVAIAVAGIVTAIAIPGFRTIIITNRLSSAANEYIAALTEAKMEAVKRNRPTLLCAATGNPAPFDSACAGAGTVVALTGSGATDVIRVKPPSYTALSVANVKALRFSGQGLAREPGGTALAAGLVAEISSAQLSSKNRRCIYMAAGSVISTCTVTGTSTCPSNEPTNCL